MQIVKARIKTDDRRRRIDGWIKAIADANAVAEARPEPKVCAYLVTYRVGSEDVAQGTEAQRRSAVIELIRSIGSFEEHAMTSTWVVRLHIRSAATVLKLLSVPLDVHSDGLHVAQISYANRDVFGRVDLEP